MLVQGDKSLLAFHGNPIGQLRHRIGRSGRRRGGHRPRRRHGRHVSGRWSGRFGSPHHGLTRNRWLVPGHRRRGGASRLVACGRRRCSQPPGRRWPFPLRHRGKSRFGPAQKRSIGPDAVLRRLGILAEIRRARKGVAVLAGHEGLGFLHPTAPRKRLQGTLAVRRNHGDVRSRRRPPRLAHLRSRLIGASPVDLEPPPKPVQEKAALLAGGHVTGSRGHRGGRYRVWMESVALSLARQDCRRCQPQS